MFVLSSELICLDYCLKNRRGNTGCYFQQQIPVPWLVSPPPPLCCKYERPFPTWTQRWERASKYRRKLYLAMFLRCLLVAAGHLLALTWQQIKFYSYRAARGQGLSPFQLGALVDPQLGMFRVVWGGMCGAEVEGRQPAHGCRRGLTLRRVCRGRGIDLRQGWVTASRTRLLRGPPLRKGEEKVSMVRGGAVVRTRRQNGWRCKQDALRDVIVYARLALEP